MNCRDELNIIEINKVVSVLPNDYSILENKPRIDGIELTKDTTLKELNVLPSDASEYKSISFIEASKKEMSVLTVSEDGSYAKIAVSDIKHATEIIKTVDTLDKTAEIGNYQFVLIKN